MYSVLDRIIGAQKRNIKLIKQHRHPSVQERNVVGLSLNIYKGDHNSFREWENRGLSPTDEYTLIYYIKVVSNQEVIKNI